MTSSRKSNRREFLKGRAAKEALEQAFEDRSLPPPASLPSAGANSTDTATTTPEQPRGSFLIQISRRAMAADFQIYLNAGQHPRAEETALAALDLVEQLEEQMTVYREHSELSAINRRAAEQAVEVEPRLFELLSRAVEFSRATVGAFDITAGPLSKLWGFTRRQGRFPDPAEIEATMQAVGWQRLQLDPAARTIRFEQPGVQLNLGAIGKGFALDRCGELLAEAGVTDFVMHGGHSSVLACGSRAGRDTPGWPIAVRHPLKPDVRLGELRLCNRALGTSGSGTQFFHHQGRRFGHVLDPRRGWPAEGTLSATVLAADAATADALSTAFYVLGFEAAKEFCQQHPGLAAIFVCPTSRAGGIEVRTIGLNADEFRTIV